MKISRYFIALHHSIMRSIYNGDVLSKNYKRQSSTHPPIQKPNKLWLIPQLGGPNPGFQDLYMTSPRTPEFFLCSKICDTKLNVILMCTGQ